MPERSRAASAFDFTALSETPTRAQLREFRRAERASGRIPSTISVLSIIIAVFVGGFLLMVWSALTLTLIPITAELSREVAVDGFTPGFFAFTGFFALFYLGSGAIGWVVFRSLFGSGQWRDWWRLSRFASANALGFATARPDSGFAGAIFGSGTSRSSLNVVSSTSGRRFEIGNYTWTTGSGKNSTKHLWGYLALQLDRALPNMVLDSRANNGLFNATNLPAFFTKDQVLSLEGDFDRYFTLYCPSEYERDALYVFTPDLMALLIDTASPFDVEIVDDWMFVYSVTPFASGDVATWRRLATIIDSVGQKTLSQSKRYNDERANHPDEIAPQGRRLRRGVSAWSTAVVVVFMLVWLWSFVSDFFSPG